MSSIIDGTASVHPSANIGEFCVIEASVSIGPDCEIGHHVVLRAGTAIGSRVRIDDHTSIGKQPMKAANSAITSDQKQPPATIGDDCLIGANAVLYAGCTIGKKVLVADQASVREDVSIGDYTIVGRGVSIESHCTVGSYCKLETNVYLTAYSSIGDRVFVAPGVLTSNDNYLGRTEDRFKHFKGVTVKRGGRIGVGAVILPGKTVEEEAVVAAGAVLTRDATKDTIYAGVPAKKFRDVPQEQKLDDSTE